MATTLKKFKNRHDRLDRMNGTLQDHVDLLRPGTYRITPHLLYRDRPQETHYLSQRGWDDGLEDLSSVGPIRHWSHRVRGFNRVVTIRDGAQTNGHPPLQIGSRASIILSGRRKDILLDPMEDRVLMVYHSERAFQAHSNRHPLLEKHFRPPPIVEVDAGRKIVVEAMGWGKHREQWSPSQWEAAEAFIWRHAGGYLTAAYEHGSPLWGPDKSVQEALAELRAFPEYIELAAYLRSCFGLDRVLGLRFPTVHGHGDLKMENLVYRDGAFSALDWEFSRHHLFFFDLLHWIYREARYFMNLGPLERYLGGDFDEQLAALFHGSGVTYDPGSRKAYLGLYLVDWLCDRGTERDSTSRVDQADFHKRFLELPEIRELLRPF